MHRRSALAEMPRDASNVSNTSAQRAWSKPVRTSSASLQHTELPPPSSAGETQLFLAFVSMLASKQPEERHMLVQAALQEANSGVGSDVSVPGRGMRRSVSEFVAEDTGDVPTSTGVIGATPRT